MPYARWLRWAGHIGIIHMYYLTHWYYVTLLWVIPLALYMRCVMGKRSLKMTYVPNKNICFCKNKEDLLIKDLNGCVIVFSSIKWEPFLQPLFLHVITTLHFILFITIHNFSTIKTELSMLEGMLSITWFYEGCIGPSGWAVVFLTNPKNYAAQASQHSIHDWLLGWSICSSTSSVTRFGDF